MKIRLLAILIILVLPACGVLLAKDPMWPDDLPRYEYFLQEYQRDLVNTNTQNLDQYLLLIKKVLSLASILTFWVSEKRFHDIREFL
jgi:hypothetical protein